jgi:hypothetical protein
LENREMPENGTALDDHWDCLVCGKPSDGNDRRAASIPGDEPGSELRFCSSRCAKRYRCAAADIPVAVEYDDRLREGFALMLASEYLS